MYRSAKRSCESATAMDFDSLATLDAIARTGSLSSAAREGQVAVSTAARRIEALEASLRLRLVDRRPNGAVLTPEGLALAEQARPLLEQAARLARTAAAYRAGADVASVRVSATEFVVSDILAPALPALRRRAQAPAVELRSEGAIVSLALRDADLAVRMSPPQGASLLARKLPAIRLGLFLAPALLKGAEPEAADPAGFPILTYDDSYGPLPELAWLAGRGLLGSVVLRSGSTRGLLMAAVAGAGLALLPAHFARRAGLVELPLADGPPPRTPWLVAHPDIRRLPRVAAVHRWIVDSFRILA
jgi:molybdate transport repressor ModE-like protein